MPNVMPDPDFIGFNGVYVGGEERLPPNQYDLSGLAKYLRETGKKFADLTDDEKAVFIII